MFGFWIFVVQRSVVELFPFARYRLPYYGLYPYTPLSPLAYMYTPPSRT